MLAAPAVAVAQTPDAATAHAVDQVFAAMAGSETPGCALGVYRDGAVVYAKGYGMANLELGVPITPSSIFQLASVSKQFTAMVMVLLAQDGKLSLDVDIHRYVPEVPTFGKTITIRQLLTHTSGIRDGLDPMVWAGWRYPIDLITVGDAMDMIERQERLEFDPGTDYSYSNTGYWLLGVIVKRVTGQSLKAVAEARIFGPLGMTHTHFHDDPEALILGGRTQAYEAGSNGYHLSIPIYDMVGAGGVYTTVEDLARWDRNFRTGEVGGPAALAELERRAVLQSGDTLTYALGLTTRTRRGAAVWEHSGADGGYRTHLLRIPEKNLGVAVLCNVSDSRPRQLADQVVDLILGDGPEAADSVRQASSVTLAPAELAAKAGFYQGGRDLLTLAVRDGRLRLGAEEGFSQPLTPLSADRFAVGRASRDVLTFTTDGGARVIHRPHPYIAGKVLVYRAMPAAHPSARELAGYAGTYWSQELGVFFRLAVRDGALILLRRKFEDTKLEPTVADAFVESPPAGTEYRFRRDRTGRVTEFVINAGRAHGIRFVRTAPGRF
jgi:CubicO group peptidase (beta-lactamase class C family)